MKKIKDYSQMLDVVTTKWQKVDKNISTVETYIEKFLSYYMNVTACNQHVVLLVIVIAELVSA